MSQMYRNAVATRPSIIAHDAAPDILEESGVVYVDFRDGSQLRRASISFSFDKTGILRCKCDEAEYHRARCDSGDLEQSSVVYVDMRDLSQLRRASIASASTRQED